MGRILVSGFEPFGGERVNPSVMICEGLDGEEILPARPEGGPEGGRESGRESVRASSVILPVTWDEVVEKLVAAARGQAGGDRLLAVVMLGQAGGSPGLAVERLAVEACGLPATAWAGEPPAAGFIHIPYLPEQAIGKKPIPPSLSETDIGRAVRAALRATAEVILGG